MHESNVDKKYLCTDKVDEVRWENVALRDDSKKQVDLFVKNNIGMANNWVGTAGDGFLFAANTLACYLTFTMKLYDDEQDLLKNYKLAFQDIDKNLAEINALEVK
jgi:hypothetical protein